MADQKFKSKVQLQAGATLPAQAPSTALILDASGNIISSPVTSTELGYVAGVTSPIQTQFTALSAQIAAIPAPLFYAGTYDASTNTPSLDVSGARVTGAVYRVTVAGTHDFGAFGGPITFRVGDKAVYNGTAFEKWDVSDEVSSVNGLTGDVVLTTTQVAEGTALYFTDERAQDAVGAALTASPTVTLTYNDAANTIAAAAVTQLSITSDASGLKLVGDSLAPGSTRYYGTDGSGTKGFFAIPAVGSPGDLQETTFAMSQSIAAPASVTGFAFSPSTVRGFKALVTVSVSATASLYETFELIGVNRGGSFDMAISSVGDESGVIFSITAGGQVQYQSASYAGFTAGTIHFRAQTLST